MSRFWDLVEKSTLVSGLIALIMVATACYAVVQELTLPEYYQLMLGVIVGYFFSEKVRGVRNSHTNLKIDEMWEKAPFAEKRVAIEMAKARNVHERAKEEAAAKEAERCIEENRYTNVD